jgi:RNA polymerase sigma factor (sigma-70 family)
VREDAEDVAQEAMLAAFGALRDGETPPENLRAWLYRVAHNKAISLLRRRREHDPLGDGVTQPGQDVVTAVTVRDRLRQIVSDLRSLPDRQRSALVMRELSGLGYTEIATALECNEAAAMQTVFEARSALMQFEQGRELACTGVQRLISDGDRRSLRARRVRAHVRSCDMCRSFERGVATRTTGLRLLFPVVAAKGGFAGLTWTLGSRGRAGLTFHLPGVKAGLAAAVVAAGGVATISRLEHHPRPTAPPATAMRAGKHLASAAPMTRDVAVAIPGTRVARIVRTRRQVPPPRAAVAVRSPALAPRSSPPSSSAQNRASADVPVTTARPVAVTTASAQPVTARLPATTLTIPVRLPAPAVAARVDIGAAPAGVAAGASVSVGAPSTSAAGNVNLDRTSVMPGVSASVGASSRSAASSGNANPADVTVAAQLP